MAHPSVARASTVPSLLAALQQDDPGPRLTWYGGDGERIELSARTLTTWVAKTANLLVEEFDAGPGSTLRLDLPAHWKTVVWYLAALAVGVDLVGAEDDHPDLLVSDRPNPHRTGNTVLVALASLARRYPQELTDEFDYAAEITSYPDHFDNSADHPLPVHHPGAGGRVLLRATDDACPAVLAVLRAGGSVVLADAAVSDATLAAEHVTAAP